MKKFSIILILIGLVAFYSCEESSDLLPIGNMEASVDGTAWKAITRVTILESGYFTITGTSSSGDIINVTILGNTVGTYELDASLSDVQAQMGGFYKPESATSDSDNYVATVGSVELTEVDTDDKKISGTFEMTVSKLVGTSLETIEITNGEFENLKYTAAE